MLIKRVIRYLKGRPRVAITYCFQEANPNIVVLTDSDWAGDELTRRSTSGGVVLNGTHTVTGWCKPQARIALSSCEAELKYCLKGAIEGLNAHRLANDLGMIPSGTQDGRVRRTRGHLETGSWQDSPPARHATLVAGNRGSWRTDYHSNSKV